ncbi:MAG: tripartite tricarboxylate transporter TctB family protein [Syntrophaceae bacterium]|nr:tripartite tricarboxylate transporter TctB family protein [Syntrophaceae bacterium]
MKFTLQAWMSLVVMVAAASSVVTALKWPLQTALFPVSLGVVVFLMALAVFLLEQFGKGKEDGAGGQAPVDFQLSQSGNHALTNKRTLEIFLWILGFAFLIVLVGFHLSIPIYFVAFLRFKCKESWRLTITLSGIAWAFFYCLFVAILHTYFEEGWLQKGLSLLGIWN